MGGGLKKWIRVVNSLKRVIQTNTEHQKNVLEKLRKDDEYTVEEGDRLNRAWDMWKASREQLVIELPKHTGICIKSSATPIDGYEAGVRDVANVLTNAGLTVKLS